MVSVTLEVAVASAAGMAAAIAAMGLVVVLAAVSAYARWPNVAGAVGASCERRGHREGSESNQLQQTAPFKHAIVHNAPFEMESCVNDVGAHGRQSQLHGIEYLLFRAPAAIMPLATNSAHPGGSDRRRAIGVRSLFVVVVDDGWCDRTVGPETRWRTRGGCCEHDRSCR